jgi:hypothetical protein
MTGELGTITVRDENGKILHFAHHFAQKELHGLLKDLDIISFEKGTF